MKKLQRSKKRIEVSLALFFILFLASFLRFYKMHDFLFFGMDQEYEAFLAKNIITLKHFPLIGVNASDTGLYLGPAFIYFASILFYLFSGNPLGWAITASLIGTLVCFLIYKIGKEMFSERTGLYACLFYSVSFLTAFYDRKFWNASFVPLFSLLIGYLLFEIGRKKSEKLVWLGIVYGFALQSHLSLLIFLPLILYVVWVNRKHFQRRTILVSVLFFLLLQAPILLFDLRHNFTNTKAAVSLFLSKTSQTKVDMNLNERSGLFLSTLGRFFWVPIAPDLFLESGQCQELAFLRRNAYPEGILFILLGIGSFVYWCFTKRPKSFERFLAKDFRWSQKIIISIFLLTLVFVVVYNRYIFEYYFLYLFPWLAIALGLTADHILKTHHGKLVILPFIFLFLILNIATLLTSTFSYSYKDKMTAIKFARKYISGENYTLEAVGDCPRFGGYRYLFSHFIDRPAHSYMDSYFGWLYPDQIEDISKDYLIVLLSMIDARDKKENIKRWEEEKLRFLKEYDVVRKGRFGKIQLFILAPQKL